MIFPCFFKVFQAQILRKYPRRPSRSFWYHLELRRPKFDRFRPIFFICFSLFPFLLSPKICKSNFFPLLLKEQALKPCSGPRSRDLLHGKKKKQLCTTKSDRLGDKRRSRLSPKPLTKCIPLKKHVLTSGSHRPEKRKFTISLFLSFPFHFPLKI